MKCLLTFPKNLPCYLPVARHLLQNDAGRNAWCRGKVATLLSLLIGLLLVAIWSPQVGVQDYTKMQIVVNLFYFSENKVGLKN